MDSEVDKKEERGADLGMIVSGSEKRKSDHGMELVGDNQVSNE